MNTKYKWGVEMITKGQVDNAVRRALNLFDEWLDITGIIEIGKHTGYYYELQGIIEDAVHCGIQEATGDFKKLNSEKPDGQ